jgi:hypothetical protein
MIPMTSINIWVLEEESPSKFTDGTTISHMVTFEVIGDALMQLLNNFLQCSSSQAYKICCSIEMSLNYIEPICSS